MPSWLQKVYKALIGIRVTAITGYSCLLKKFRGQENKEGIGWRLLGEKKKKKKEKKKKISGRKRKKKTDKRK